MRARLCAGPPLRGARLCAATAGGRSPIAGFRSENERASLVDPTRAGRSRYRRS